MKGFSCSSADCPNPTMHPLPVAPAPKVTGRELRGCEGVTTVDGPWLDVVDVAVADHVAACNWETVTDVALSHGGTEGRVP